MLKEIRETTLINICPNCSYENEYDVAGMRSDYLEEYGEYENLGFLCESCGSASVFNMNIPIDDTDEPFMTGDLPEAEEIQRFYTRVLIRLTREDQR